jgi:hypothetical protein
MHINATCKTYEKVIIYSALLLNFSLLQLLFAQYGHSPAKRSFPKSFLAPFVLARETKYNVLTHAKQLLLKFVH